MLLLKSATMQQLVLFCRAAHHMWGVQGACLAKALPTTCLGMSLLINFLIYSYLVYLGMWFINCDGIYVRPETCTSSLSHDRHEIRRNDLIGRYGFRCRSRQSRNTSIPLAFGCKESGMSTGSICTLFAPICSKHHVAIRHLQHA